MMPALDIHLEGDGMMHDVPPEQIRHTRHPIRVSALAGGMQSGKPSVAFGIDLGDGTWVLAETSLALFLTAADALKARYGDPRR